MTLDAAIQNLARPARPQPVPGRRVGAGRDRFDDDDMGRTETLFAVGNGYLGLRGNVEEGRDGHAHGTFVNGFHETWPIRHAEEAFGFAQVGQTIVNAPDAKMIRLYVDDEPLVLDRRRPARVRARARLRRRRADAASCVWRTPRASGCASTRAGMVSFTERHLAVHDVRGHDARRRRRRRRSRSQILNRQDGEDEYDGAKSGRRNDGIRPAQGRGSPTGCCSRASSAAGRRPLVLGYRCTNSGMTIAVAADHSIETENEYRRVVAARATTSPSTSSGCRPSPGGRSASPSS